MHHKKKLNSLNFLIEVVTQLNNKLYKLAIKIRYSNLDNKAESYLRYSSY